MSRIKYVETNIPKNVKLRVQYLDHQHVPGLPRDIKRITVASLFDSLSGRKVTACASCCPTDNDNRKIGRAIAIGRALKQYYATVRFTDHATNV